MSTKRSRNAPGKRPGASVGVRERAEAPSPGGAAAVGQQQRAERRAVVLDAMAGRPPLTAAEVAEHAGVPAGKATYRVLADLVERGEAVKVGPRWQLPTATPAKPPRKRGRGAVTGARALVDSGVNREATPPGGGVSDTPDDTARDPGDSGSAYRPKLSRGRPRSPAQAPTQHGPAAPVAPTQAPSGAMALRDPWDDPAYVEDARRSLVEALGWLRAQLDRPGVPTEYRTRTVVAVRQLGGLAYSAQRANGAPAIKELIKQAQQIAPSVDQLRDEVIAALASAQSVTAAQEVNRSLLGSLSELPPILHRTTDLTSDAGPPGGVDSRVTEITAEPIARVERDWRAHEEAERRKAQQQQAKPRRSVLQRLQKMG